MLAISYKGGNKLRHWDAAVECVVKGDWRRRRRPNKEVRPTYFHASSVLRADTHLFPPSSYSGKLHTYLGTLRLWIKYHVIACYIKAKRKLGALCIVAPYFLLTYFFLHCNFFPFKMRFIWIPKAGPVFPCERLKMAQSDSRTLSMPEPWTYIFRMHNFAKQLLQDAS